MTPAENALDTIYPAALRVVAAQRLLVLAVKEKEEDSIQALGDDLINEVDALASAIDCIEAGAMEGYLSTSIAGAINQMRLRASHN